MIKIKSKYLKDIKDIQAITLIKVCKDNKINYSNVYNGTASEKTIKLARDEFIKELKKALEKVR